MRYVSTRGDATPRAFCDILLEGLAPDGGLYLPAAYPKIDATTLARWRGLAYADLAFEILSLYIDDIPAGDLRAICRRVYSKAIFGTDAITPLKPLDDGVSLVALSNGPTLAFKDMAMQLLGALFEYELARRGETLNILGATSGDTGSAAEYAMRGKRGIRVFMLSPHGRMSAFQQAQMFSLQDENIHNLAVEGVFDECQDIVKAVGNDLAFKRAHRIGTVNSINWARLVAQVVYYFAAYFQSKAQTIDVAVPSGNFGNICAGHVARLMGLPIGQLVCATNENDVLDEFFRTGAYRPRAAQQTHETSSPSMDISKASNFERFVFDLLGRDGARVQQLFTQPAFTLTPQEHARIAQYGFVSGRSTHADRLATIRGTWERSKLVIDTHTADGLKVAREHRRAAVPMLVLETALPAKFAETIREALGHEPERPPGFEGIESLPKRFTVVAADVQAVKRFIEAMSEPRPLLSLDAALARLTEGASAARIADAETVSTFDALGRVLAQDVVSPIDVPPQDNTSMDGYAVRAADVPAPGTLLPVSQRIAAGRVGAPLASGTAARIFTGAHVPAGADAVVMQEQCEAAGPAGNASAVRILAVPQAGQWIRRRGEDVRSAATVLTRGARLTPQALGLAATVGAATLKVVRRPRVALFSTGDELVMPGSVPPQDLPPGAIYNSNRYTLRGLLQAAGCEVTDLGIVPDRLDATREALRAAARHNDLILTSGGVSVGEEDHIRPALATEGRVELWQVAMKPGKPLAFGAVRRGDDAEALFIGLPGNPVSSFVTFLLAVAPVLRALQGADPSLPQPLPIRADFDWPRADKRREFLRVRRNAQGGLDLFANQSSGVLTSAVWADGLVDNPPGQAIVRGDVVRYLPLASLL